MSQHKRRVRSSYEPISGMTSMIDVVFLLLVFFIVTIEPMDLLAKLPVDRPQPSDEPPPVPPALTLTVTETGYLANGKRVSLQTVDEYLQRMNSRFGLDEAHIICHGQSEHRRLIQALDICMKNNVTNLSMSSR